MGADHRATFHGYLHGYRRGYFAGLAWGRGPESKHVSYVRGYFIRGWWVWTTCLRLSCRPCVVVSLILRSPRCGLCLQLFSPPVIASDIAQLSCFPPSQPLSPQLGQCAPECLLPCNSVACYCTPYLYITNRTR